MKEKELTDEQIIAEINELVADPKLRRCSQCAYSNEDCTWCSQMKKPLAWYMYAGMCKYFETDNERICRETRENLKRREAAKAKMQKKANQILTLSLNYIEVSMLFLNDFASRVEKEYKVAQAWGESVEKEQKADEEYINKLRKASLMIKSSIEEIERKNNRVVMPIFNKAFTDNKSGVYDNSGYDDHQQDVFELAQIALRYFNAAYLNDENATDMLEYMRQKENASSILEEEDFKRYNFRR